MGINVDDLDTLQLDGLREVANVGAGHAATALSQMVDRRVNVDVPQIRIVAIEDAPDMVGGADEPVAAVLMQIFGDITGRTVHLFPAETARRLSEILLRREGIEFPGGFGEMERSALREVGNIVAGAYLTALSDFLGMVLLPSVPELALDMAGAVLTTSYLNFGERGEHVLCLENRVRLEDETPLRGHFLLLPGEASLQAILRSIRLV